MVWYLVGGIGSLSRRGSSYPSPRSEKINRKACIALNPWVTVQISSLVGGTYHIVTLAGSGSNHKVKKLYVAPMISECLAPLCMQCNNAERGTHDAERGTHVAPMMGSTRHP